MYNSRTKIGEFMSKLVVISGPSGVGKGTVVKELQKIYQEKGEKWRHRYDASTHFYSVISKGDSTFK